MRSVDLDEWTQRQIDAMRLGGNANARKYFREHGLTDMHGKIEKKYTSKAARTYKVELEKQVEAAAAQRGEGTTTTTDPSSLQPSTGSLLENLSLQDQADLSAAAAAASVAKPVGAAVPSAKLASQLDGAKGRLVVTPPTSGNMAGGLLSTMTATTGGTTSSGGGLLRKPAGKTANSKMLLKKPSGGGGNSMKLRVNKLPVGGTTNGSANNKKLDSTDGGLGGFDDDVAEEEAPAPAPAPVVVAPPVVPTPAPKEPEKPPQSAMQNNVSKLQAMNSDFFSGV